MYNLIHMEFHPSCLRNCPGSYISEPCQRISGSDTHTAADHKMIQLAASGNQMVSMLVDLKGKPKCDISFFSRCN